VSIHDALFRDNQANDDDGNRGGAVFSWGCDLTIENVTFDSNRTFQGGGEMPAVIEFGGGALAAGAATGLANQVELTNVTFFGNRNDPFPGQSAPGGAVLLTDNTAGSLTASLTNVTFAGNVATFGGDDLFTEGPVALTVKNVIFGGGGPTDSCGALSGAFALTSGDGNLDVDGSCDLDGPGDQTVADTGLESALFDHGGFAPTLMLETGSPAIDGGTDTGCPATDQRGVTRPQDGDADGTAVCDSGAVELMLEFTDGFESGDTSAWTRVFP
jgi:hypothetical protein